MSSRQKKIVVLLLKIAVLLGIAEYARRQAQVRDAISVQTPAGAALVSEQGQLVTLARGTRLEVTGRMVGDQGVPLTYQAVGRDGARFDIRAADVATDSAGGAERSFVLLPGIGTVLKGLDGGWMLLGFLLFGPPIFLMIVRWRILLRASGIDIPFFVLVRLHYLGFFFNTFMPGGAGGDVVKAVYLTRHCSQKAEAATIVVVDRVVGMIGLVALAAAVVIAVPQVRSGVAVPIGVFSLALTVGFALFFSPSFRRLIRYEKILARLPRADVLGRIDAALYGLRSQKSALLSALALTVALQLVEVVAVSFAGRSLGLGRATFAHYLAFVPIGYVVNALPISFGGVGLMEGAFLTLFRDAGAATATQAFMLAVAARLLVVGWGLLGAVSALFPPEGTGRAPAAHDAMDLTPAASEGKGRTPAAHGDTKAVGMSPE